MAGTLDIQFKVESVTSFVGRENANLVEVVAEGEQPKHRINLSFVEQNLGVLNAGDIVSLTKVV